MLATISRRGLARSGRHVATVAALETAHPGDIRALQWLQDNPSSQPRCILGKTEGNGCVNDFTRGYASHMVYATLGERGNDASIIMSGGTEGVLCPHFLMFADDEEQPSKLTTAAAGARLSYGVAKTRDLAPHEIGRQVQIEATRDAVLEACERAKLNPEDMCFAQIKCPLLTPERVASSSGDCIVDDGYSSMGYSRGASALGVALATGELAVENLADAASTVCQTSAWGYQSAVASASAGIELLNSEVFVFGNSSSSTSSLRAAHCTMRDPIDVEPVFRMLREAGIPTQDGTVHPAHRERIVAVLAKADPVAQVRGFRTTMLSDSDLHATRHARASVAGLLAGVFGTPQRWS